MKSVIAIALLVCAVAAVPIDPQTAETTDQKFDNIGVGPYSFSFQTNDGKSVYAEGQLKNQGTEGEALEVRGQYSYTGDDGQVYTITYIANELGYQPQGAHIP
uniref:Cuticular protein CPR4B n=1 Tax=Papilio xuthus TaxID=66420 RepID=B2DBG4_PAPXU|nr:flexible cuticle protein 12-like precursor [Papilio xuthus]BAG30723.1 cuticular protein CPR4B [Papilio xuthus]